MPVVRKRHRARRIHLRQFCQLFALLTFRQRPDYLYVDEPHFRRAIDHRLYQIFIVDHRLCIGHRRYRREAARRRRFRAAQKILFVFLTRFAKMYVHVDQPRRHYLTRHVNRLVRLYFDCRLHRRYVIVHNHHVRYAVKIIRRIYHSTVFEQD